VPVGLEADGLVHRDRIGHHPPRCARMRLSGGTTLPHGNRPRNSSRPRRGGCQFNPLAKPQEILLAQARGRAQDHGLTTNGASRRPGQSASRPPLPHQHRFRTRGNDDAEETFEPQRCRLQAAAAT
jgi:hypothetical protein